MGAPITALKDVSARIARAFGISEKVPPDPSCTIISAAAAAATAAAAPLRFGLSIFTSECEFVVHTAPKSRDPFRDG